MIRKIVLILLISIVFGGFLSFGQKNKLKIKFNESKIFVPYQFNEFKEVGNNNRYHFNFSPETGINMEYLYLDTSAQITCNNKFYTISNLNKFVLIHSMGSFHSSNYFDNNAFINNKDKNELPTIYYYKNSDSIDSYTIKYNTVDNDLLKNNNSSLTKIEVVYNYYQVLNLNLFSTNNNIKKWLVTYKTLKINNEFITVQFACIYNGIESIKWIAETSEIWCHQISDMNYNLKNKNNVLKVKINGVKIKIPNLNDNFVMVFKDIEKHRIEAGDFTFFYCNFIDNSNYYLIHESDTNYNIKLRYFEVNDMTEYQDDDENKNIYKIFPYDTTKFKFIDLSKNNDAIDKLINYIADTNGDAGNKINEKNCIIHVSKDAISSIKVYKGNYYRKKFNSVEICYYIIIKNRYLRARFVSEDNTTEDIIWVKETSEKWVQAILEANK